MKIQLLSPAGEIHRNQSGIFKTVLRYAPLTLTTLAALGVESHLGGGVVPVDGLTALVKSPGVPGEVPQVAAAAAAAVASRGSPHRPR